MRRKNLLETVPDRENLRATCLGLFLVGKTFMQPAWGCSLSGKASCNLLGVVPCREKFRATYLGLFLVGKSFVQLF